jgi:hypothetical protein
MDIRDCVSCAYGHAVPRLASSSVNSPRSRVACSIYADRRGRSVRSGVGSPNAVPRRRRRRRRRRWTPRAQCGSRRRARRRRRRQSRTRARCARARVARRVVVHHRHIPMTVRASSNAPSVVVGWTRARGARDDDDGDGPKAHWANEPWTDELDAYRRAARARTES